MLRKQLHCPHSNDLLAPPRGVQPKNLKGGDVYCVAEVFFAFLFNEGAFTSIFTVACSLFQCTAYAVTAASCRYNVFAVPGIKK